MPAGGGTRQGQGRGLPCKAARTWQRPGDAEAEQNTILTVNETRASNSITSSGVVAGGTTPLLVPHP